MLRKEINQLIIDAVCAEIKTDVNCPILLLVRVMSSQTVLTSNPAITVPCILLYEKAEKIEWGERVTNLARSTCDASICASLDVPDGV
jgi:hypothetical protein